MKNHIYRVTFYTRSEMGLTPHMVIVEADDIHEARRKFNNFTNGLCPYEGYTDKRVAYVKVSRFDDIVNRNIPDDTFII